MVQKYIKAVSNRGAVISRSMASAAVKALLVRYPDMVGMIDVENSSWAKSLFQRMSYSRRKATTAKLELLPGTLKEVELVFYNQIVEKVEKQHSRKPNSKFRPNLFQIIASIHNRKKMCQKKFKARANKRI